MLKNTDHGKLLIENGFESDIKECAKINSTDVIPFYNSGVIKKLELTSDKPKNSGNNSKLINAKEK